MFIEAAIKKIEGTISGMRYSLIQKVRGSIPIDAMQSKLDFKCFLGILGILSDAPEPGSETSIKAMPV